MREFFQCAVLNGRKISAVCFVFDYIQFGFDGYRLTALADPILVLPDRSMLLTDPGYRDGLCGQIGRIAAATDDTPEKLKVVISSGTTLVIPLDGNSAPGPEMAHTSGPKNLFNAWLRIGH